MAILKNVLVSLLMLTVVASFGIGCGGCSKKSTSADVADDAQNDGVQPDTVLDGTDGVVTQSTIQILAPKNGQLFTQTDEDPKYNAEAGLQLDIEVRTTNLAGRDIRLVIDGQVVETQSVSESGGVGNVTFSGVTMPHRPNGVTILVETTDQTINDSVSIKVDLGNLCFVELTPSNSSCFLEDANPNRDGFQARFTITNSNGCDSAFIEFRIGGGVVQTTGKVTIGSDGVAVVEVDLTTDNATPVTDLSFDVKAVVEDSKNPARKNQTTQLPYRVDTEEPSVTLTTPPVTTIGAANDADPAKDGIQFSFSGTSTGISDLLSDTLTLAIDGTDVATTSVAPDGTFLFKDVTFTQSGSFAITVKGSDGCRSVETPPLTMTVSLQQATLAITSPTEGTKLLAKDDGDPNTTDLFETKFVVQATDVVATDKIEIRCKQGGGAELTYGSLTVAQPSNDGSYSVDVALPTGSHACRAVVVSVNPAQSAIVNIVVGLPAPILGFSLPIDGATVTSTQLPIVLFSKYLAGRNPTIRVLDSSDQEVVSRTLTQTLTAVGLSTTFALTDTQGTALPDGAYKLEVNATDSFGNLASDNPQNTKRVIQIVLDSAGPGVAITTPAGDNPTLTTDKDNDLGNGFQSDVVVTLTGVDPAGGTMVCIELNGNRPVCTTLGAGETAATFTPTWLQGTNQLVAYGIDKAGNKSNPVASKTVNVDFGGLRVEVTAPPQDQATTSATVSMSVKVLDGTTPVNGATLTVKTTAGADLSISGTTTTASDGTATFDVTLPAGETQLIVIANGGGKSGTSDVRRFIYIDQPLSVTLTNVKDNDVI
ncbi:MAG: hypothetical protein KC609_14760, partial [Myxococcales bacterium]|nr:hypothetical protein [Myxococcales bacterium]